MDDKTSFDQRDQKFNGSQTNIGGGVTGTIISGNFQGPFNYYQAPNQRLPLQRPFKVQHFLGREKELTTLLDNLQPGCVYTLCGPAGVGKTALATEAIWRLAPENDPPKSFPDGIIFHNFENQPHAEKALETIAQAYGEDPRSGPAEAARLALASRQALLFLDAADNADDLYKVLEIAGNCGVLITTQRHSDAPGESMDLSPLARDHADQLFVAWGRDYAGDQATNHQICELLGGLPLMIVLAGKYLAQRHQQATDFLSWLEETPEAILVMADKQHKSIFLMIERSLAHLQEASLSALNVIGILAFEPFKSSLIAASLGITELEADRSLGELVDYGLIVRPPGKPYQVCHGLAHMYLRKLMHKGEVLERLSDYLSALIPTQSDRRSDFSILDANRSHILALQLACRNAEKWSLVRRLAFEIDNYLDTQGHLTERASALEMGLLAARAEKKRHDESLFLDLLGRTHASLGEYRKAIEFYEQSLAIDKESGERQMEGDILGDLGFAYYCLSDYRKAMEYNEQSLAIAREIVDRESEDDALCNIGRVHYSLGHYRKAIEYNEQSLAIAREIGDREREGNAIGCLGSAHYSLGHYRKAIQYHEQRLAIAQDIGDREDESDVLGDLGNDYYSLGEYRKAIEYNEQSKAIAQEIGARQEESEALGFIGLAHYSLSHYRKAIEYNEKRLPIAREIGDREGEGQALLYLGLAYYSLCDYRKAIEYTEQSLAIAREIGDREDEGDALDNLGSDYCSLGDYRKAIDCTEQSLAIAREIENRVGEGEALADLGSAYCSLGDYRKAIDCTEQSLAIARDIGDRDGEGEALADLGSAYCSLGDYRKAIEYTEQSLAIAREIENRDGEGEALGNLGGAYCSLGDYGKAIEYTEQSLAIAREIENRVGEGNALWVQAVCFEKMNDLDKAIEKASEALKNFEQIESPSAITIRDLISKLSAE